MHRLAADDWSLPAICSDLSAAGQGELPPAPELTYPDYAAWQRTTLAEATATALAGYWRDTLAGVGPAGTRW